jgi:hypothetical protein
MTKRMPVLVWMSLLGAGVPAACATGGAGNDPSFGTTVTVDGEADAGPSDDAPAGDDGESADADTCSDAIHGAAALVAALAGHALTCTMSSQCPVGQCCFANSSVSACVMQ